MKKQTIIISVGFVVFALLTFGAGVGAYTGYMGLTWDRGTTTVDDPALVKQLQSAQEHVKSEGRSAIDILFLGRDTMKSDVDFDASDGFRTELVMVAHIPADRSGVQLVSIPTHTWVPLPGHGHDTIDSSAVLGGLPLAVESVSEFLDIAIDHVALVDLNGLGDLTELLGGVEVDSSTAFESGDYVFRAGLNRLDGAETLAFLLERAALPNGGLQCVRNQQEFIRAIGSQVMSTDYLLSPLKMSELIRGFSPYLTVDAGLNASTLVELVARLGGISGDDIDFITVPTSGNGTASNGDLRLQADHSGLEKLKQAIADDTVSEYVFEAGVRDR